MTVEVLVVLDESLLAVLLGDKEDRGRLGRYRRLDLSTGQILVEEFVEFLSFLRGQGIDTPFLWFKIFHELDLVIEMTTVLWKWYISFRKDHCVLFILFR